VVTGGHIAVDEPAGVAWVVDHVGGALVRVPLDGGGAPERYPFPESVGPSLLPAGTPGQIAVAPRAVFVSQYSDNQLLRFDKAAPDPATSCTALVNGVNPCMSEIFLPVLGREVHAHSLAFRDGKLWFTMTNEASRPSNPKASIFGFVDAASWAAGSPRGVYYKNLSTLGPQYRHPAIRGIAVDAERRVALADGVRKQLLLLTPRR
jgi:hypothetical protein